MILVFIMSKEKILFFMHNWYINDSSTASIAMYNLLYLEYFELF